RNRRGRRGVEEQLAAWQIGLPVEPGGRVPGAVRVQRVVHLQDLETLRAVPGDGLVVCRHEAAAARVDLSVEVRGVGGEAEAVASRLDRGVLLHGGCRRGLELVPRLRDWL